MSAHPAALIHGDLLCAMRREGDLQLADAMYAPEKPVRCPCAFEPSPLDLTPLLAALDNEFRLEHAARLRVHVRAAAGEVSDADALALEELCAARRLPARRAALARQLISRPRAELPPALQEVLEASERHAPAGPRVRGLGASLIEALHLHRDEFVPPRLDAAELRRGAAQVLTELAFARERLDLPSVDVALQHLCASIEAGWARDALRPDEVLLLRILSPGVHSALHARALGLGEMMELGPSWCGVTLPGVLADEILARARQLRGAGVFPAGVVSSWEEVLPVALRLWLDAGGDAHDDTPPWAPRPEGLAVIGEALEAARLLCAPSAP